MRPAVVAAAPSAAANLATRQLHRARAETVRRAQRDEVCRVRIE